MDFDSHTLLRVAHLVLFAYWLGADLGVFVGGGYMSRPSIGVDERNQIRKLVMDIDLAPRIALVAMLPVGFQLSLEWGAPVRVTWIPWIWLVAIFWIAALVAFHFAHHSPMVRRLMGADVGLRWVLMVVLASLGLRLLFDTQGEVPPWLAAKLVVFALIILVGIILRRIAAQWRPAMERFAAGDVAGGEGLLFVRRRKAKLAALLMWALVAAAAVLGAIKPFADNG